MTNATSPIVLAPRRAKRSGRVSLSRMVGAMSGAALLAGCGAETAPVQPDEAGPKQEVLAFENQFECQASPGLSEELCATARKDAVEVAAQTAPRFGAVSDCEGEWGQGNCVAQTSGGQSFFMPFVGGFILGKVLAGNRREVVPLFRKGTGTPLQTANGVRLGYGGAPGKYVAAARAFERPASVPKIASPSAAASKGGLTQNSSRSGGGFVVVRTGG